MRRRLSPTIRRLRMEAAMHLHQNLRIRSLFHEDTVLSPAKSMVEGVEAEGEEADETEGMLGCFLISQSDL